MRLAKTMRPSGTSTSPLRTSRCVGIGAGRLAVDSAPRRRPDGTSPMIARSVVVLPAPLAPISVTISPSSSVSETPLSAWIAP